MAGKDFLFTSESVSEGHPDKLCDQVSDAILDAHLAGDPNSRVACESLAKTGMVVVAGEITSSAKVSYVDIVREVVRDIGYTDSAMGFDGTTCAILTAIEQQSPDISQGVTEGEGLHKEQGADRKSTRLNSSHLGISYAVFCLKKKKTRHQPHHNQN